MNPPIPIDRQRRPTLRDRLAAGALATLLVLTASDARAADEGCATVQIFESEPQVPSPWRDAVTELRARTRSLPSNDCPSAELFLRWDATDGGRMVVSVTASDNRGATRIARTPSALPAIALGLVASIPPEVADDGPQPSDPHPDPAPAASTYARREPNVDSAANRAPPPLLQVSLGASTGARTAVPTSTEMLEVEGFVNVYARDWLVTACARYVPVGWQFDGIRVEHYLYEELTLGLAIGRRASLGLLSVEASVGPILASTTESSSSGSDLDSGFTAQVRFDGTLRFFVPLSKPWRAMASIDGELDPFHVSKPVHVDPELPVLPTWSLAFRVGAAGDVL